MPGEQAVELAKRVARSSSLRLVGVMALEGPRDQEGRRAGEKERRIAEAVGLLTGPPTRAERPGRCRSRS
jgi:hypothetical protein